MTLVDTSVWIDHRRRGNARLSAALEIGASHEEVLSLVERRGIVGKGLGWVDAHLLASAMLGGTPLWTLDRALSREAEALGVFGQPEV